MAKLPFSFQDLDPLNDINDGKSLNIVHRHIEEKADGSRVTVERSLDHQNQVYCKGSDWLVPKNPEWIGKPSNPFEKHFREDKKSTLIRQTTIIEDGRGNKIIDEKAVKQEDNKSINGTKCIGTKPNSSFDDRGTMLDDFSKLKDPFQILGEGKNFIPLIDGGK